MNKREGESGRSKARGGEIDEVERERNLKAATTRSLSNDDLLEISLPFRWHKPSSSQKQLVPGAGDSMA